LVDTNVWLERMLDQERSEEVGAFLGRTPSNQLFITDFALHSIGLVLSRLGQLDAFTSFLRDLFIEGSLGLIRLEPADLAESALVMRRFSLDFDDAYQYTAATSYGLTLVSFDTDFDRTELGRKSPAEL
jgi:predicted nucleic acid-binding protein